MNSWIVLEDFYREQLSHAHQPLTRLGNRLKTDRDERKAREGSGVVGGSDLWMEKAKEWLKNKPIFEREVVERLPAVKRYFLNYWNTYLSKEVDQRFIEQLIDTPADVLNEFSDILDSFAQSAPKIESPDWKRFTAIRDPLSRIFLLCPDKAGQNGALFGEWLRECPCRILDTLSRYQMDARWDVEVFTVLPPIEEIDIEIFCPQRLLDNLMDEILTNASVRHRKKDELVAFECRIELLPNGNGPGHGKLQMTALNSASYPDIEFREEGEGAGKGKFGLKTLQQQIALFDGTLEYGPNQGENCEYGPIQAKDWTYKVTATFVRP